jgi:hypothetical protein
MSASSPSLRRLRRPHGPARRPRLVTALLAGALGLGAGFGVTVRGAPAAHAAESNTVVIDGLKSTVPTGWKESPTSSPMRFKQFTLPRDKADAYDAELVIFFFGAGQGGGIEANLDRWKKMFEPPAGKTLDQSSKVDTMNVGKVKTTVLDVRGTYMYKASPMAPGPAEPRSNHRMLAVVFESPQGPYFMRFVGPERTVEKHRKDFEKWLKAFK